MTEMVRKQIYIHRRQADSLTRLAEARGVSEAEIVRQAIDHEAVGSRTLQAQSNRQAWETIVDFAMNRQFDVSSSAYQWQREDAYDERDSRFD